MSSSAQTSAYAAPRKFTAATSRQALKLAREALGDDAMVLASESVENGFEVTALGHVDTRKLVDAAVPESPLARETAQEAAMPRQAVLSEIHAMRSMIEERLSTLAWNDPHRRDPVRGRLLGAMLAAGFSARLAKAMLERLPAGQSYADGESWIKSEMQRALPVRNGDEALLADGGVYALVGPTGVGKTTTTAKLAARCLQAFGSENMALVTIDTYRIGAAQQLQIYGQLMNVPVYVVRDKASLAAVLEELRDKRLVLIDTEGRSQRDRAVAEQIALLGGAGRAVKRLLLLNAAAHGDALNEVVYAYQHAKTSSELVGCIFTKLDEAPCYGALLEMAMRHRLPVFYVSNGQKVPENLGTVEAGALVHEVLQTRDPKALFACDPGVDSQPASGDAQAQVAQAVKETTERLRSKYERQIRALAHDAQEVAEAAKALDAADVGFAAARHLWSQAHDAQVGHESVAQQLMALARVDAATSCERHILAVCGRVRLDPNEQGDSFDLHSALLLSDRSGQPMSAPNQWLATESTRRPGARQIEWLRQQEFGLPVVHLLPRVPAVSELVGWNTHGQRWMARAVASDTVVDPASGSSVPLSELALPFGEPKSLTVNGKSASVCEAQHVVELRTPEGEQFRARCVARRVVAGGGKRVLEQTFVLTNMTEEVDAATILRWQAWAQQAESCLRLTSKGLSLIGGIGPVGDPALLKRVLVAGQVATTAWRLQQEPGERAARTRTLLIELAGRQVRTDRATSGNVLYEGLAKLFYLLDALGTGSESDCGEGQ